MYIESQTSLQTTVQNMANICLLGRNWFILHNGNINIPA